MSNELDKVEVTQTTLTKDQPQPGPSSWPASMRDLPINVQHSNSKQSDPLLTRGERDRHVNNRQSAPLLIRGEGDRSTPLNRQSAPLFTRGEEDRLTPLNTREEKKQASKYTKKFIPHPKGIKPRAGDNNCQSRVRSRKGNTSVGTHPQTRPPSENGRSDQVATHIDFLNVYKTDTNKVYIFVQENKIQMETSLHPRLPSQSNGWSPCLGAVLAKRKNGETRRKRERTGTKHLRWRPRWSTTSDMESDPDSNSEQEQSTEDIPSTPMEEGK